LKFLYQKSFFIFLLFANFLQAQNGFSKKMTGRIILNSTETESINISNQTTERATVSDSKGNFIITVSVGDLLFFSAVNLKPLHYTIQKEDFEKDIFVIKMFSRTEELEEVLIEKSTITTESVGIIPRGIKTYTPAERKLMTAGGTPIDAMLNTFSGRMSMLKKEIEVEKKEKSLVKTEYLFEDKYYVETLKIPSDYIKGFQYYCVEDFAYANALQAKNKILAKFLLVNLSKKYLALINHK
jgi:hypothetical protein